MIRSFGLILGFLVVSMCSAQSESVICAFQRILGTLQAEELVYEVRTKGSLLFVGEERSRFVIYDISESPLGEQIGVIETGDHVYDFEIIDDYAYLANDDYGLTVVDISDPTMPTIVGNVDTPSWAIEVMVRDGYAYLTCARNGVHIIDVHDPTNPVLVSSMSWFGNQVFDLDLDGQLLYVLSQYQFIVLDISDPANPVVLSQIAPSSSSQAESICLIDERRVLMPLDNGDVQLLNLDDPSDPQVMQTWGGVGMGDVHLDGDRILSRTFSGLFVYRLNEQGELIEQGEWRIPSCYAYWIGEDGVYLAGGDTVRYYEGTDPAPSPEVSRVDGFVSPIKDQVLDGEFLYAVSYGHVYVFDMSDPSHPTLLSDLAEGGFTARSITKRGSNLVVSVDSNWFRVIDASDPAQLVTISGDVFESHAEELVFVGDYLCVTSGREGVAIYDLADPTSPNRIGEIDVGGTTSDICAISDSQFAVLTTGVGVSIVDISNPSSPELVDTVEFNRSLYDIAHSEGVLVVTSYERLNVLTRNQDHQWQIASELNGPYGGSVNIELPYAFISGMRIIDIADPYMPELIGEYFTSPFPFHASLLGDFVVVGLDTQSPNTGGVRVVDMFSGCGSCSVDLNADGTLNFFDVAAFLVGYQAQDPLADWNGDGAWDYFDVSGFIMDYLAGCP